MLYPYQTFELLNVVVFLVRSRFQPLVFGTNLLIAFGGGGRKVEEIVDRTRRNKLVCLLKSYEETV